MKQTLVKSTIYRCIHKEQSKQRKEGHIDEQKEKAKKKTYIVTSTDINAKNLFNHILSPNCSH